MTLTAVRNEAFMELPLVKMLYLNYNYRLDTLEPRAFVQMLNLNMLYLNDNNLTQLYSDMFLNQTFLPALQQVGFLEVKVLFVIVIQFT